MRCLVWLFCCLPLLSWSQYTSFLVGNQFNPNEPAIIIDAFNPDHLVAGSNIDKYYYSDDGGETWSFGTLSSSYGVWGDPCIVEDTNGYFYFFHLSNPPGGNWIDRIVCQKSTDGGLTWSDGSYMGLNGTKAQDKEWAAVDPVSNNIYVTWTQFDKYGSTDPADSSIIRFSRSVDGGISWSPAIRINKIAGDCRDMDNTVEGALPAVGPNGEIYISWAGPEGLLFTKSLDQGITWPSENIFVSDLPGGWDFAIPGISRANGFPVTCCDRSGGPYRGRIYINWSDQRNGIEDTDIWLVYSDDGGSTWSDRIRVNDDPPGKQQFFNWMSIDQTTGYLYIVFYDRRNCTDSWTEVYLAVSRDGGSTWDNFLIDESSFNPVSSIFFGDYNNISVQNGIVRPIWTRMDNMALSLWTAEIDSLYIGIAPGKQVPNFLSLEQNYPNPVQGVTYFSYKIHAPTTVSLKIYDCYGKVVATIVDEKFHNPGSYIEQIDIGSHQLSNGFYFFSLISSEQTLRRKMIVE